MLMFHHFLKSRILVWSTFYNTQSGSPTACKTVEHLLNEVQLSAMLMVTKVQADSGNFTSFDCKAAKLKPCQWNGFFALSDLCKMKSKYAASIASSFA